MSKSLSKDIVSERCYYIPPEEPIPINLNVHTGKTVRSLIVLDQWIIEKGYRESRLKRGETIKKVVFGFVSERVYTRDPPSEVGTCLRVKRPKKKTSSSTKKERPSSSSEP